MKLDKTKYEDDKIDQQKEEEERLLIVMVKNCLYNEIIFFCFYIVSIRRGPWLTSKARCQ